MSTASEPVGSAGEPIVPVTLIAEFSEVDMNKISNAEAVSRRKALALVGLGAVLGLSGASLSVSDAEAQTVGMERRQGRRAGRQDRRQGRRTGRQVRREDRRQ